MNEWMFSGPDFDLPIDTMSRTRHQPLQLSRLESLPVELIQKIFLFSLEVNLPRASIHIARILSTPSLYTWLIRLAFSSANEGSRHGFFTPDFLPEEIDFFALSTQQRTDLQTAILECRWCTLPLMRKCQREYVEHAIRRKCQDLVLSVDDRRVLSNISDHFADLSRCDHGIGGRRGRGDLLFQVTKVGTGAGTATPTPTPTRPGTERKMILAFWFHFGAMQIRRPGPLYFATDLFRLPSCPDNSPARIPDKLLCPPWTESKIEFLRLLSLDAYIDEDSSCTRSKRVLRHLIRSRDFQTFRQLLDMYIRKKDYNYPILWPVRKSHFHDAIDYAEGKSDPFVKLLFRERWDDVPVRDSRVKEFLIWLMC